LKESSKERLGCRCDEEEEEEEKKNSGESIGSLVFDSDEK